MYINISTTRIVIGRFSIAPGDKIPAVPYTTLEEEAIKKYVSKGYIELRPNVVKAQVKKKVESEKKPEPEKKPEQEKNVEQPVEKKAEPEKKAEQAKG